MMRGGRVFALAMVALLAAGPQPLLSSTGKGYSPPLLRVVAHKNTQEYCTGFKNLSVYAASMYGEGVPEEKLRKSLLSRVDDFILVHIPWSEKDGIPTMLKILKEVGRENLQENHQVKYFGELMFDYCISSDPLSPYFPKKITEFTKK